MSSIDGRLLADRWTAPANGINAATLREHYDQVASRFDSEGWIVGRTTMEEIMGINPPREVKLTAAKDELKEAQSRGDVETIELARSRINSLTAQVNAHEEGQ